MNVIQMSVSAGMFILFCVIVRLVMVNKLPKRMFLLLWGMALCKLLIPVSIDAKWSVFPYIRQWVFSLRSSNSVPAGGESGYQVLPLSAFKSTVTSRFYENPWFLLWLAVAVVLLTFSLVCYWYWNKRLAQALPLNGQQLVEEWLRQHPIKRQVTVLVSDQVGTPLTYGILHPKLILPKRLDYQNELQLTCILAHEWAHIRRFDALWKLLLTTACCIHWFNPFVWLLYWFANRDLELACDETVVKYLGEEHKSQYALSLIHMADKNLKLSPLYSSFSKNSIEERIISIMKFKKTSMVGVSLCLLMALGATAVFAATTPETKDDTVTYAQKYGVEAAKMKEAQAMDTVPMDSKDMHLITATEYAKQMENAKTETAQQVKNGELTQAEADALITEMDATLKAIQNGEITVYQGENISFCYSQVLDAKTDETGNPVELTVSAKTIQ